MAIFVSDLRGDGAAASGERWEHPADQVGNAAARCRELWTGRLCQRHGRDGQQHTLHFFPDSASTTEQLRQGGWVGNGGTWRFLTLPNQMGLYRSTVVLPDFITTNWSRFWLQLFSIKT